MLLDAGFTPDDWQTQLLRSQSDRILLLSSRQAGKTESVAALALKTALTEPKALVILLSPSERQSGEMAQRVFNMYEAANKPVRATKWTALQLHLENGSRIIGLPESEKTIRGYSGASLLVIDEASRVDDGLYRSVRPMLGTSKGRLVALSTPFGKRGFFYDEWSSSRRWERIRVTADRVPRLSPEFLHEERLSLGERWYAQEYMCSFEDAVGAVFSVADITAAVTKEVSPKW